MELLTLDESFQPVRLVENYESLIWTERYSSYGDFVLVTPNIEQTLNLMPLESTVTIRESTVPMVVESHKIQKPGKGVPKLEVRGRSCETWLERRASVITISGSTFIAWQMSAGSHSDAAYKAIRAVIGDSARSLSGSEVLAAISPAITPLDAIPQVNLPLPADYNPTTGEWVNYEIPRGELYQTVLELLNQNHHGLKAVRPMLSSETKIDLEIYNGADLTETIRFDARFDQFDDSNYFFSKQGSRNIGYIFGSNGAQSVRKNDDGITPEVSGLDRRVLLIDETGDSALNSPELRKSRALIELYKYNSTALFDGETSYQMAEGFNNTYFLGDILSLVGEYAEVSEKVRVAEFIRAEEPSGHKAYPTFEVVEE